MEVFGLRLLLSRKDLKSSREWRKLGEHSGFVKPGKNRGIVQGDLIIGYDKRRNWGKKEEEYQDVFWAYLEVLKDREKARLEGKGRKGRRGINIEIGNKLVERFGWEKWKIDSYIISRYLKRAKMRWYAPDLE